MITLLSRDEPVASGEGRGLSLAVEIDWNGIALIGPPSPVSKQ